ncbi:NAD(P)-binding domain-containing protein [Janibacter limosus]|uniref:NAD(P)-binding domain-containing protein n=1 Tax=Janibacter limosus TaxID=53458 RepID=A0AC61U5J4_9MICO|nr:NAD(P)-binding domain-containing protein [Janibacter limosus]UUZ45203.1 NAD(P)-binding domain-containing protein [Janibacter limosus]
MRSVDHASAADERPPVAFIGTGQIGGPMVRRLLADGVEVHVHARRPDVRDDLAAAGAVIHESVARAVAGRSVVLVCLYDDSQLREVCLGTGPRDLRHAPRRAAGQSYDRAPLDLGRAGGGSECKRRGRHRCPLQRHQQGRARRTPDDHARR